MQKMNMNSLPDESLFRAYGLLFVRHGRKAYQVQQTGPMSYAATGVEVPLIDLMVDVAGRLPGFRPPKGPEKGKKGKKGKKTVSGVEAASCSCATKPKPIKPAPAVDGAVEDVNALARHVRTLNNKIAALRREMEQGPKPRKARKVPAVQQPYDDEDMPF